MLKDLLAALDKWPTWKRITESPTRLDALEARIATLEAERPAPKPSCLRCGSSDVDLGDLTPSLQAEMVGANEYNLRHTCRACGASWEKLITP